MKFKAIDEQYFAERKQFAEKYGARDLWSVIDHWPLYCGIANLARFLAIADLLRSTLPVPGHVAEFGSWRGANLLFLAKLLRIYDSQGSKTVHCFDSFQGLTSFAAEDADAVKLEGSYKGSLSELRDVIELYKMTDEIVIHTGLIEETLPRAMEKNRALSFSFVYCDVDLYEATRVILEQVHPRLQPGGVIVFDEWNDSSFPGEGVAANEFLRAHSDYYLAEGVQHARKPSLVLRKVKM